MENQEILKFYNKDEIKQLLNSNERLVFIDNGTEEIVAKYDDLPESAFLFAGTIEEVVEKAKNMK